MPGPAVKGRSGLVSRSAGYYTKCFGAHDGDSFLSSFRSKNRTRTQTVRLLLAYLHVQRPLDLRHQGRTNTSTVSQVVRRWALIHSSSSVSCRPHT